MRRLADLAKTEERRECEEMGRLQRSLDQEEQRLTELEEYRRDYARRFDGSEQLAPARWQDYQNFLQRIDRAMAEQKNNIQAGKQARDAHRRRWLVKRQKLDSIERVVDRFQKSDERAEERKQQKSLDELYSAGRFVRGRSER